jgi:hypothetical protein
MQIGAADDFTVSFALDGYAPQTLTVHSTMSGGGFMTAPSPVLNPPSLSPTLEPVTPRTEKLAKQHPRSAATGAGVRQ